MAAFNIRFLPGSHGFTIEYSRSDTAIRSGFNSGRIREFRAIIRQDDREEGTKIVMAEAFIEEFDPIKDRGSGVSFSEEDRHKIAFKPESQKNF